MEFISLYYKIIEFHRLIPSTGTFTLRKKSLHWVTEAEDKHMNHNKEIIYATIQTSDECPEKRQTKQSDTHLF